MTVEWLEERLAVSGNVSFTKADQFWNRSSLVDVPLGFRNCS